MDIVLIGSGNTATVLGRKSVAAGHRILQVFSPQRNHAVHLAKKLGASPVDNISGIERRAGLIIIALRDEGIGTFMEAFGETKSLVAHTAGALSINEVQNTGDSYGVLYPLQSLRKEIETLPPLTILVEGNKPESTFQLIQFASTISATVIETDDHTRLKYHLAATLINNFTNSLFSMTAAFCEKEDIDFSILQPLMEETVTRLRNISPKEAQTGPAQRNDQVTLQKHRELLNGYPDILKFYDLFTEAIQKSASGTGL